MNYGVSNRMFYLTLTSSELIALLEFLESVLVKRTLSCIESVGKENSSELCDILNQSSGLYSVWDSIGEDDYLENHEVFKDNLPRRRIKIWVTHAEVRSLVELLERYFDYESLEDTLKYARDYSYDLYSVFRQATKIWNRSVSPIRIMNF